MEICLCGHHTSDHVKGTLNCIKCCCIKFIDKNVNIRNIKILDRTMEMLNNVDKETKKC